MPQNFYGYDEDDESPPKGRDNLFLWTVFILLLIGLTFACWLGSFYIFGHPEQPRAYRLLKKLHKIEAPKRFEVTAAPGGEFLSAQKLFDRYASKSRLELEIINAELMRNYIVNYRETAKLVPYIRGRFIILDSYELTPKNFFPSGVVALAQSADSPQVLIEHVYTADAKNVPLVRKRLQTGLDMSVERTMDLSAVIHIEKVPDGRLLFSVVPLLYGSYALKQGSGAFGLQPPAELNPEAGMPITKIPALQAGIKKFADYRFKHPLPAADSTNPAATPAPRRPELVRVDPAPEDAPAPNDGPPPDVPAVPAVPVVATPIPMVAKATPKPAATPAPKLALNATPAPKPAATPVPVATPLPKVSPQGVALTPFLASNPSPGLPTANGGKWRTYAPGKLPAGRSISPTEATSLAERGDVGERVYLRGQFLVTASNDGKAVLRPQAGADPKRNGTTSTRIIVEYPNGAVLPSEGSMFSREEGRGFEVRDVRRGADGLINIYVREVIAQ